jgi:lipoprotein-anchoring transpeptidase ErfK/SrfK
VGTKTVTGSEGQYEFANLKAGDYTIDVTKTGYADLKGHAIKVEAGKTQKGDAQMEKLPASLRVVNDKRVDIDTLDFGATDIERVFNIFNDGPVSIDWEITNPVEWITISPSSGTAKAGATQPVRIFIVHSKMKRGANSSTVYVTAKDNGSKALYIKAYNAVPPAQASITGDTVNTCPATSITLTVDADGATSYKWYKGSEVISNAAKSAYTVTESGTYYAAGVNVDGEGAKSAGKTVVINLCPPAQAVVSGSSSNTCPNANLTLTANATGATSYKWYKGNNIISDAANNTYTATENGTYYAVGINTGGEGIKSAGKTVVINLCPPAQAVVSGNSTNTCPNMNVTLTANATGATSYKWYKGSEEISSATNSTYTVTESGTYYATGVNADGDGTRSAGKSVVINSCPPAKAVVSGNSSNTCPNANVTLTANATDATSYKWYKGSEVISSATNSTYTVTESGTYYATGVNADGEGTKSTGKTVTIENCAEVALVGTSSVTNIMANSATINGVINRVGVPSITERGFCYAFRPCNPASSPTYSTPTIDDSRVVVSGLTNGAYSVDITGYRNIMCAGGKQVTTIYYVRAYAIQGDEVVYGNVVQFSFANN